MVLSTLEKKSKQKNKVKPDFCIFQFQRCFCFIFKILIIIKYVSIQIIIEILPINAFIHSGFIHQHTSKDWIIFTVFVDFRFSNMSTGCVASGFLFLFQTAFHIDTLHKQNKKVKNKRYICTLTGFFNLIGFNWSGKFFFLSLMRHEL